MNHKCRECQRLNPAEASFCYFDGTALDTAKAAGENASIDFSTWAFPMPFVFPSGARCNNFMQLAQACQNNPQETADVLQRGFLGGFFGSLGRVDLAMAAQAAAKSPDSDRGVDELLGKLPGSPLRAGVLAVEPAEMNLGVIQVGSDNHFELNLTNKGDRLIQGKVVIEACPWLGLGDSETSEKLFQFFDKVSIPIHVRGKLLRAKNQSQKVEIAIESNGGNFVIEVQVNVPVKPFAQGALSGATSPRQLAEKAKANTKEASGLLENGSVAQWYEANGWTYPVQGPTATGIAAVQQFFEVLGLVKPPKVELSESVVALNGKPGARLEYVLSMMTQEKRAAVAHAVSDQPWLTVGKTLFRGQTASIPLVVDAVPNEPNQTLKASVKVTGNGNQRFDVPVSLRVGDGPPVHSAHRPTTPVSLAATLTLPEEAFPEVIPVEPAPQAFSPSAPAAVPYPAAVSPSAPIVPAVPTTPSVRSAERKQLLIRALPLVIVLVGLLTAVAHDLFFREKGEEPLPEIDFANPRLALKFHDEPREIVKTGASMRFGLGVPDPKDPKQFKTRLLFDPFGQTCNVCVRIDKAVPPIEFLWGIEQGVWDPMKVVLGKDLQGRELKGARSVWKRTIAPPITITQHVEIVPGGLSENGDKRLLDTCLVYYTILNEDTAPHDVGLRFLLDTYIGNNDAVPFTIAGAKELCDTMKVFNKGEVPDYISAMEIPDVKNPGTLAHLSLKYGGLEPPTRVTLGAWPAATLRPHLPANEQLLADMHNTRWVVPVASMALAKPDKNSKGDSAVTMYWDQEPIPPKGSRVVGFAYGLGNVSGDKGDGQLGMTAGGELIAEKEFTLTAYVKNPAPGSSITLTLPSGIKLAGGTEKESVPPVPAGSASPYSPVTWRVKAVRGGVHRVTVTLNSGVKLEHRLVIKQAAEVFK